MAVFGKYWQPIHRTSASLQKVERFFVHRYPCAHIYDSSRCRYSRTEYFWIDTMENLSWWTARSYRMKHIRFREFLRCEQAGASTNHHNISRIKHAHTSHVNLLFLPQSDLEVVGWEWLLYICWLPTLLTDSLSRRASTHERDIAAHHLLLLRWWVIEKIIIYLWLCSNKILHKNFHLILSADVWVCGISASERETWIYRYTYIYI